MISYQFIYQNMQEIVAEIGMGRDSIESTCTNLKLAKPTAWRNAAHLLNNGILIKTGVKYKLKEVGKLCLKMNSVL